MNLHNRNKLAEVRCRPLLAGAGLACLLGIVGCKSTEKTKDDPLLGVKPAQVNPVPPTTGSSNNSSGIPGAQSRAVPPIPGSTSAGSNAALASLPGGRPLFINDPRQPANGATPKTNFVPNVQPIPRESATVPGLQTTGSWTQTTPPITPNHPTTTPGQGDSQFAPLQVRGSIGQFVENVPEGVRLKVLVPSRTSNGAVRVYDAIARDVPAAVQAIVEQIDSQRS